MSAAASGFNLPFIIKTPTQANLLNVSVGTRLIQKTRIMNLAHDKYAEWVVKSISSSGIVVLQPMRGLRGSSNISGCIFDENLTRTLDQLKTEFYVKPSQDISC